MDIRVVKTRLENIIVNCVNSGVYVPEDLRDLLADVNEEIEYNSQTIDSGRVATVIDELRSSYFTLIDKYDAIPRNSSNASDVNVRADLLDKIMTTNSKINNYLSYAIAKHANSTNLDIRRSIPILQGELDNFKKQQYDWCTQLRNLMLDKKYLQDDFREDIDG